jgi:DNA-binding PadR family transcriptional regulator
MKTASVGALSPEFVLLGFLAQGPAHGYELHQRLSRDLNQLWHLSQSQIYNILNRLERQDYIRGTVHEQTKLPAKRSFELTDAGYEHFETWLSEPTRLSVRAIRIEFTSRLYFSLAKDRDYTASLIAEQISDTNSGLTRLIKAQAAIPDNQVFNRLGLDLRIRQIKSILEWLESCYELVTPNTMKTKQA